MISDLLSRSPLLVAPLVAMFVFLAVFIAVIIRVMTRPHAEIQEVARLPLDGCEAIGAQHPQPEDWTLLHGPDDQEFVDEHR